MDLKPVKLKKPKKNTRLLYSREALKEALAAIKAGMPINTASIKYHIPRSTLHSKKTNKHADKRPGPDTVLTVAEENSLVQWIFNCSKMNMPVSKQQLLNSVAFLVKILNRENPFANGRPGRHWYQSFLRRNVNILGKISENGTVSRAAACKAGIQMWFSNLKTYLTERNLINIDPSRIFTTETAVLMSPDANEDKNNLFVQISGSATGQLAPSMLLFTYQRIPGKVHESMPNGWICGKSENGFMTAENFYEYITKCFHPWVVENKVNFPVILFIDGRVPHLTVSLTDFCLRNKIELIALHPNASQVLQPLEVAMFTPLKAAWHQQLVKYRTETKAVNLLKENVAPMLKTVFDNLDVATILKSGFEACGLYPLSEDVVNYEKVPKKVQTSPKVKSERLEFTPYIPDDSFTLRVKEEPTENMKYAQSSCFLDRFLDPEQLHTFKTVNDTEEWTGRIEDTSLFYVWRKIKNLCKTDADNFSTRENSLELQVLENMSETDDHSDIEVKEEDKIISCDDIVIEDPLKICVIEMKEA